MKNIKRALDALRQLICEFDTAVSASDDPISYRQVCELGDDVADARDFLRDLIKIPQPRRECEECSPRPLREWQDLPQDSVAGSHRNAPLTDAERRLIANKKTAVIRS